jgi:hypothetical protein
MPVPYPAAAEPPGMTKPPKLQLERHCNTVK